ncbi:MAG: hypothetical protein WCI73_04415 [Phycisphaerae bacterium]
MTFTLQNYHHPTDLPRSPDHQVRINGEACDVLRIPIHGGEMADVVIAGLTGTAEVEILCTSSTAQAIVRPLHLGIQADLAEGRIRLQVKAPIHAVISRPGAAPVFLLLTPPPEPPPADAIRLAAGVVHDLGTYDVPAGKTLWVEGGAVLRGAVRARGPGAAIRGHGIIDGSAFSVRNGRRRSLVLDRCDGGVVEGVTIINPSTWSCVLGACDRARVRGLRVFGDVVNSDGIDLVGCRDTVVEDCLLCVNDDCVAIKAVDIRGHPGSDAPETDVSWARDISNLLVQRCILLNGPAGSGTMIGGETCCDHIRDITWRDLDILCVHGHGSPFGILADDRATISMVRYEDIRVEHHWDRLIDVRIVWNKVYSRDSQRGQIRDLSYNRIRVAKLPCNYGHTVAVIGGYDAQHTVQGVHFTDFILDGLPIREAGQMQLFTRDASDITFA